LYTQGEDENMKKYIVTASVIVDSIDVEVWANTKDEAEDMALDEVHSSLSEICGVDFDYTIVDTEVDVIEDPSAVRFARVGGI